MRFPVRFSLTGNRFLILVLSCRRSWRLDQGPSPECVPLLEQGFAICVIILCTWMVNDGGVLG
jgi:hypothetical protein